MAVSPPHRSRSARAPARVLVVDEDAGVRQSLCDRLTTSARRCRPAASADEALHAAATEPFDVAVIDVRRSRDCGVALRRHDPDLALVMVTDAYGPDAATAARQLGATGLLRTPFSDTDLVAAVDSGLERRRRARSARAADDRQGHEIKMRSTTVAAAFADLTVVSVGEIEGVFKSLGTPWSRELFEHGQRTSRAAVAIAEAMGCADADAATIGWGALLHDVGKLALPSTLILKPGALTDAETEVLRTHPRLGADILAVVPQFQTVAAIVLASHERYDGKGYPFGLAGSHIPLGGRITTVADALDAMVHGRVYREPVSSAFAAAELVRGAGGQFDPDVVHAWLRAADRLGVCA